MSTTRIYGLLLALLSVVPVSGMAAEFQAGPLDESPVIQAEGGRLALDLKTAREIALARNLDLRVGRYDLAVADAQVEGASALFDPKFSLGVHGDYTKSPAASQLEGADVQISRNTAFTLGLGGLLPTGGQLNLDFNTNRTETNSQFYFLNPSWFSRMTAGLTQPLLKNFGTLVSRSGIVTARTTRKQAAENLKLQVIEVLRQVDQSYWDFTAAQYALEVKRHSLELAEQLLDETRERIRVGTSAPIDRVQSEASVAARRQDVILAENALANAEDALKKVLGFETVEEWNLKIDTTESYEFKEIEADLRSSIEEALGHRPEIIRQRLGLQLSELNIDLARNAMLPQLDLKATYGFGGLGGTMSGMDPVTGENFKVRGGFDDSFDQIVAFDYPQWVLGLNLTMPLGNTAARADLARRRFEKDRTEAQMSQLKQSITHEVRLAVRALHDGAASVEAAVASRKAAEENVEAEQTKFDNGLSTNFQVLQIQDDLATARLTEIQARLQYRRAIVGYLAATGRLLDEFHVTIADEGPPEDVHKLWKDVKWMQFVDLKGDRKSEENTP